jgi:hypothetical protein
MEFEDIVNGVNSSLLNSFSTNRDDANTFLEGLGLTVERYNQYNQTVLQTLYNALANGKYALIGLHGINSGLSHAVLAYGINARGEIMVLDSGPSFKDDTSEAAVWSLPYHKLTANGTNRIYNVNIISL